MAKWCGQLITNNRLVSIPIVPADVDPLSKIIVSADKKLKYSNVAMKMEWKPTAKTAEFVTEMGPDTWIQHLVSILYKIYMMINVFGSFFLVTVNFDISYFCDVIQDSVCVVIGSS